MSRPRILLASIGTDGDIYPFLGLGAELRARGYEVTLAANEDFAGHAATAGIQFCPFVSTAEFGDVLCKPEFWHPTKGPVLMARWGARLLQRQYEMLSTLATTKRTVLVASPGALAARLIQEKLGVPLASVILQPWMVPSLDEPPVMMGGLTLPRWAPRPVGKIYLRLLDGIGALLLGRELNRLRATLGLPRMQRMFQWWLSPELVIGMFPDWFGDPQPDWPQQLKLACFPRNDGQPEGAVPGSTIEFCRAGPPPVAFTFGTGMRHAAELFQRAVEACRTLEGRAIFITNCRAQLPSELPSFVHHCEFAPFQKLFPFCAAVVHHGGIGTVAKALAAGTPQLILPFAFDQMDNALRVKKLGAGDWLKRGNRSARALADALRSMQGSPVVARAQILASRFRDPSGLEQGADLIEGFLSRRAWINNPAGRVRV